MKCLYCNSEIKSDWKFCIECGEPTSSTNPTTNLEDQGPPLPYPTDVAVPFFRTPRIKDYGVVSKPFWK